MPRTLPLIFLLLLSACGNDAARQGRQGNDLLAERRFEEAAQAYTAGIRALDSDDRGPLRPALWNNLGTALYRQDAFQRADSAFRQSLRSARTEEALVRAAYNAGNSAYQRKQPEQALAHYRSALLTDPNLERARFNYEFVKRSQEGQQQNQQQQQQNQNRQQQSPTPSDYARALKRRADSLVQQHRYRPAHQLMQQGIKVDRTVSAYQTFIDRLGEVSDINRLPAKAPPDSIPPELQLAP